MYVETGTADFQSTITDLYQFTLTGGIDAAVVNLVDAGITKYVVKAAAAETVKLKFTNPVRGMDGSWFVDLISGTTPQMSIAGDVAGPFSPSMLSGLQAWWDFSDRRFLWQDAARTSPVTADGQAILGVTDRSGRGRHLSEATNGPTYKTAIQAGKSVARFDGTNDILSNTAMFPSAGQSIFAVFRKRSAIAGQQTAWSFTNDWVKNDAGVSTTNWVMQNTDSGANQIIVGGTATTWKQYAWMYQDASNLTVYVDGVAALTVNPLNTDTTDGTWALGAIAPSPGSGFNDVDHAEFIHYNVALTAGQRRQVEQYLRQKWGLSS